MTRVKSLAKKLSQSKGKWLSKTLVLSIAISLIGPVFLPLCVVAIPTAAAGEDSVPYRGDGRVNGGADVASSTTVLPPIDQDKTNQLKTSVKEKAKEANSISPFDVLALPTAVQFAVIFDTDIDSRRARQGDAVEAHLKEDLVFDSRLIAPAGSVVLGHIDHYVKSRTMTEAMASRDKRFHKTSIVKVIFDEIVTPEQEHIKIEGILSRQKATFGENVEREVVVDKKGIIDSAEPKLSDETMIGAQVVNFAVGTGLSQLGTVATFGVLPVVMGAIGAVNPSIITMHAVAKEDCHPRLRGLTMGIVSSLPGGPVLQSFIYRGSELNIKIGDELLVQAHSPYEDQTSTTQVSAKIAGGNTSGAVGGQNQNTGRHYYPKYQPKYTPKAGNKVLGTSTNIEDRFGLWH